MKSKIIWLFIFCFAMTGCDKLNFSGSSGSAKSVSAPPPVKGTIIAKVNNYPITLEELNQEIENYNNMVATDKPEAKIVTRDKKIEFLKSEMVRRVILYQEALARGLDRKEDVVRALEKTKQELLVMQILRDESNKIEVSSKEVEDYYNTYKEQLKDPEERQIREIVVPTEQEAKDILILLLQGSDFATLAKERSKAASAKDGGDLGYMKKGKKTAQFDAVAFGDSLEVGKTSNIFKSADGNYYLIKFEGKRGGKQKSLGELFDDIKKVLTFIKQQQRVEAVISNASKDAKLEFFEGEIK